jgi:ABC-type dipeptide/oligopeptide/nickel transport system permease component
VLKHGLRNSLVAAVTVLGLQMAWLLGGSVVVEQVFAWPGIGRLMVNAVLLRDLSVVQAGVLVFALIVMVTNLLVAILYAFINPRIRFA